LGQRAPKVKTESFLVVPLRSNVATLGDEKMLDSEADFTGADCGSCEVFVVWAELVGIAIREREIDERNDFFGCFWSLSCMIFCLLWWINLAQLASHSAGGPGQATQAKQPKKKKKCASQQFS